MSLLTASGFPAETYAVKRPLGRVWGYGLLSFGLYAYAWFHVHRKLLDGELGGVRDDATLHTFGLLVPILNFFIIHWLWRDLNALRVRFGLAPFPEIPYLIGSLFLAPLFFSLVVVQLNEYWDVRTQGLATDAGRTSFETASLVIGGLLFAVTVLSLIAAIVVIVVAATN